MAVTGAIIAVIGLGVSIDAQKAQQREAKRQRNIQNASNAAQRDRERRKAIRQRRAAQARIEQASYNTGVAGSSGELAGVGALATDFAVNEAFLASQESLGQQMAASQNRQAGAALRQGYGNLLQQVGMQTFSYGMNQPKQTNQTPTGPVQ